MPPPAPRHARPRPPLLRLGNCFAGGRATSRLPAAWRECLRRRTRVARRRRRRRRRRRSSPESFECSRACSPPCTPARRRRRTSITSASSSSRSSRRRSTRSNGASYVSYVSYVSYAVLDGARRDRTARARGRHHPLGSAVGSFLVVVQRRRPSADRPMTTLDDTTTHVRGVTRRCSSGSLDDTR